MSFYQKQAVCLNGHQLSDRVDPNSTYKDNFCHKCGAGIITNCENCHSQIDGHYVVEGVIDLTVSMSDMRWYCSNCGIAYPWTQNLLDNATEIAILDSLDKYSVNIIKQELPNVLVNSQRTALAKARITNVATKMSKSAKNFMRELLKDVIVDVTVRQMFGN